MGEWPGWGGDELFVGVAFVSCECGRGISDAAEVVVVLVDIDWAWLRGGDTGVSGWEGMTPLSRAA